MSDTGLTVEKQVTVKQTTPIDSDEIEVNLNSEPASQVSSLRLSKALAAETYVEQWKNRRRMVWVMVVSTVIFTALVLFAVPEGRLEKTENILSWYFTLAGTITCTYFGTSLVSLFAKK